MLLTDDLWVRNSSDVTTSSDPHMTCHGCIQPHLSQPTFIINSGPAMLFFLSIQAYIYLCTFSFLFQLRNSYTPRKLPVGG